MQGWPWQPVWQSSMRSFLVKQLLFFFLCEKEEQKAENIWKSMEQQPRKIHRKTPAMSKDLAILGATRCCSRENRWTCGTRPPLSRFDQFIYGSLCSLLFIGKASGIRCKPENRDDFSLELFDVFWCFWSTLRSSPGDAAVQSRSASLAARHFLGAYSTQEARNFFIWWLLKTSRSIRVYPLVI